MNNIKHLIAHIKLFSAYQWLVFIKVLENKTDEELIRIEPNQFKRTILQNSNWYSKILDLALRMSDYKNTKVNFNELPTSHDYQQFISLYLGSYDNESKFDEDLDYDLNLALAKYSYEQLKNYQPLVNDLGRLITLYESYKSLFQEKFGFTPKQILCFYMVNNAKHGIYEPFDPETMLNLLRRYDQTINYKKLKKFLDTFSISIKKYRGEAKRLGISNKTIKSERAIETYPIINLDNGSYFIPSKNILLNTLAYKIFSIINDFQTNSENFKTKFGRRFENYITDLTKFSHEAYFYKCDKLVTEPGQTKNEFYLLKNDTSLVIEAKLLHIDESVILHGNAKELKNKFNNKIEEALNQIDSCFKKLHTKNKYAIIVIHTHLPLLQGLIKLFKHKEKYNFLDNVIIVSMVDYEIMIHNSFEAIFDYFQNNINKIQIALHFDNKNKFLEKKCLDFYNELGSKVPASALACQKTS